MLNSTLVSAVQPWSKIECAVCWSVCGMNSVFPSSKGFLSPCSTRQFQRCPSAQRLHPNLMPGIWSRMNGPRQRCLRQSCWWRRLVALESWTMSWRLCIRKSCCVPRTRWWLDPWMIPPSVFEMLHLVMVMLLRSPRPKSTQPRHVTLGATECRCQRLSAVQRSCRWMAWFSRRVWSPWMSGVAAWCPSESSRARSATMKFWWTMVKRWWATRSIYMTITVMGRISFEIWPPFSWPADTSMESLSDQWFRAPASSVSSSAEWKRKGPQGPYDFLVER